MADRLVRYEARDGIGWIELDCPPANTYSYEMMRQLDEAILRARFDASVPTDGPVDIECLGEHRRYSIR